MKIAFFGTPDFAIPSLHALAESEYEITGVVTAPDKPRGRGRSVIPTPVARAAEDLGLSLLKPENLKDVGFIEALERWNADAFAVVAFRILPEAVFGMPEHGSINLHASLLPAYRGAAPIQWAIWKGETVTGVSTFQIRQKVDTGNLLLQRQVEIQDDDDAGSLSRKLAESGARLLVETMSLLESGSINPQEQDSRLASKAPKITKEHCLIDWNQSALQIHNQVRALSPHPGAVTFFEDQSLKLYKTTLIKDIKPIGPGEFQVSDKGITVGASEGSLDIIELQLQDRKRMDVTSFLRGYRPRGTFQLKSKGE